jgi:hypothetical protein
VLPVLVGLTGPIVLFMLVDTVVDEETLTTLLQLWSWPVRIKAIAVESMIGLSRLSS